MPRAAYKFRVNNSQVAPFGNQNGVDGKDFVGGCLVSQVKVKNKPIERTKITHLDKESNQE